MLENLWLELINQCYYKMWVGKLAKSILRLKGRNRIKLDLVIHFVSFSTTCMGIELGGLCFCIWFEELGLA